MRSETEADNTKLAHSLRVVPTQMPTVIQRDEVVRLVTDQGAQLVEVLPRQEYDNEHIAGAINLPLESFTKEAVFKALRQDRPVVVYCQDVQ